MTEAPRQVPPVSETATRPVPESSLDKTIQTLLEPIRQGLARVESRLAADGRAAPEPPQPPDVWERLANDFGQASSAGTESSDRLARLEHAVSELGRQIAALTERMTPTASAMPVSVSDPFDGLGSRVEIWERMILGDDLCGLPDLDAYRREFLAEIIAGTSAARALAGQLLLIQSALVEQIPELLRPVGEAYYRWRPRTSADDDPLEKALAQWLNRLAAAAGLPNSIHPVRFGERFDSSRHVAAGRGNEIISIHGWVVLRDNHRVYTKANVSVK
ncbi:MAG: hypothetical protein NTY19_05970 [Planctomycetota bacterium]|nr:hypothetical protein [Planctomycetota bacterium]